MAKLSIHMAAREYYCGHDEIELPYGLGQDDISDIEPDGYGEFMIFIADESYEKLVNIITERKLEFEASQWSRHFLTAIDGDWEIQKVGQTVEFALRYRGNVEMEFCDVDENLIDDWSVTCLLYTSPSPRD